MLPNVQIITNDDGEKYVFATGYGAEKPLLAHASHPNFTRIVRQYAAGDATDFASLFDIPATIERGFARLGERVTVKGDDIFFDGDKVEGAIVDAILGFLDAGEDFAPLVKFYEKVRTNPLGDIAEGLFDWIKGQSASAGNFTITAEGDVIGYKSVYRCEGTDKFSPTCSGGGIVNDVEFASNLRFGIGDVVEMPRSHIRNTPSAECGVGLHIGTWGYARVFSGDTKLMVKFSPRDVVSLPTSTLGSNKLRVCRYTVVDVVTEPLAAPLYTPPSPVPVEPTDDGDLDLADTPLSVGDRVTVVKIEPYVGHSGTISLVSGCYVYVTFDEPGLGPLSGNRGCFVPSEVQALPATPAQKQAADAEVKAAEAEDSVLSTTATRRRVQRAREAQARVHGKGGPTSQAAKGRGKNPAQDALGRFSGGRPGSKRGTGGRFTG